jgi:hypothetical protein
MDRQLNNFQLRPAFAQQLPVRRARRVLRKAVVERVVEPAHAKMLAASRVFSVQKRAVSS